ncbi:MAG: hypothetical protein ICV69_14595 [Thermoleophilaceae bacterium]|nr:hypothetical protein [Thermoleophilaceae bacterium]
MAMEHETGDITGTKDKDYNIIWFVEACLSNALRLETYIEDARPLSTRKAAQRRFGDSTPG